MIQKERIRMEIAERPEGSGPGAWLAHHWWWVLGAVFTGEVTALLAGIATPASELSAATTWFSLAALLVYCFGQLPASAHFSRLCVKCVEKIPVDGAARAERRQRSLYAFHVVNDRPVRAVLVFLGLMLVPITLTFVGVLQRNSLPLKVSSAVLFLAFVVGTSALAMRHRPLVPWCPHCRWGRGDDGPVETVPEPTPPSRSPDRVT
jgi:hypothetical protein